MNKEREPNKPAKTGISTEAQINGVLIEIKQDLYEKADELIERNNRGLVVRNILNLRDLFSGFNTPKTNFEQTLETFEQIANVERTRINEQLKTTVPEVYHDFLDRLDLKTL